ncbi:MAG TPA: condensation domain-containing protein [Pyrinomonadaceae bacterium]|nr:condensation domain-containing protein [Pyrinomonadaceae bacterium]
MGQTLTSPETLSVEKAKLIELLLRRKGISTARAPFIARREPGAPCPLSFAQQRLWFLDQMEPGNSSYNISADLRLTGRLDLRALELSLSEVVRRHEVLRTTFAERDGEPVQIIGPPAPLLLSPIDLGALDEAAREAELFRRATEEARRPFDLATGPLLRATLLRLKEDEHVLLVTMHHIASDGWSMGVLVREMTALYSAFTRDESSPLAELPIQYADYAAWQRQHLSGERLEQQLSYWRGQLGGAPALLELPTDRPRPPVQSNRGARHQFTLPRELVESLKELSRGENCTLFMVLLAAWQILLSRHSGQTDISVGTDIANRNREETEGLIGFFVNMLVMRADLSKNLTFRELLGRVREAALGAFAHQDLPFERIVEELRPERNTSHTPLFQVVFVLQNAPMPAPDFAGLEARPLAFDTSNVRFDLSLVMTEEEGALRGSLSYRTDLFDAATITRWQAHYATLLRSIVAQPETRVNALEILTEAEKQRRVSQQKELKRANFTKFKSMAQKPSVLSREQLVKFDAGHEEGGLPLLAEPQNKDVALAPWVESNRPLVEDKLARHGAILFRRFAVDAVDGFGQVVRALSPELLDYSEPSTPRTRIGSRIYTSTEYPASQSIRLHNEMSYSHAWPLKLWFCCVQPAQQGGATPIADSRKVYRLLDPKIRERFAEKGVTYVRNYGEGLGLPWQTVFGTDSVAEVEAHCRRAGVRFEWRGDGRLRTWQVRPAVARHPRTGETVWFNQAHVHHVSSLEPEVRESLLAAVEDQEFPLDINALFGDGTVIEDSMLREINEAYSELSVPVAWQRGDVLLLDNMLAAHGRASFVGPRKIAVAMAELQQAASGESSGVV